MNLCLRILSITTLLFLLSCAAWGMPTTCGTSGLLTQPTAQTLNSGNICVGLWGDYSEWGQTPATEYDATVMPFAITLGLGSFLEVYGSFPNLLFNDEETASGRGYAILGTKMRLLGKRTSPLQFAVDGQFKRAVSMNPDLDGLTDFLGRGIVSLRTKRFGIHGWGGILDKEENVSAPFPIGPFEDITGYGGGIEFFPTDRLRLIAEAETFTEEFLGGEEKGEWMAGFQYFISPHLTFSLGYGESLNSPNLTSVSPESRILIGFSSCQGIGSYSQIQRKPLPAEELDVQQNKEPVKMLKIKTLSPLLSKSAPAAVSPASLQGLPAGPGATEAVIPVMPLPQLLIAPPSISAVEIPVENNQEIVLEPSQNIAMTETFSNQINKQSVSPIGPPAMAATQRASIETAKKARVYRRFILPEFSFQVDQYSLTPEGSAALSMIAVELSRDNKWVAMRIDGHTDSTGSNKYNDALSYDRAVEYAMHLVAKNGIDPNRVFVKGFGEEKPIAPNDQVEGRSQNRRVELLVLVPAE